MSRNLDEALIACEIAERTLRESPSLATAIVRLFGAMSHLVTDELDPDCSLALLSSLENSIADLRTIVLAKSACGGLPS